VQLELTFWRWLCIAGVVSAVTSISQIAHPQQPGRNVRRTGRRLQHDGGLAMQVSQESMYLPGDLSKLP